MGQGNRPLGLGAAFTHLGLDAFDALADFLLAPAVAHSAGVGDVQQGALHVVVGEFRAAFSAVRHVAIGAGDVAVGVNALGVDLEIRVLHLQHRGAADGVGPIGKGVALEVGLLVVLLHRLHGRALVPGKGEVVVGLTEIVLDVALGADERAHFLMGDLVDVAALALEGFAQGGPRNAQSHGVGLVAVEAADGVLDLRAHLREGGCVEIGGAGPHSLFESGGLAVGQLLSPQFGHDARDVGALARPARGGVGGADALGVGDVLDGVSVAAGLAVFLGEGVAGEEDDVRGRFGEVVARLGAAELRAR